MNVFKGDFTLWYKNLNHGEEKIKTPKSFF
jgi:hypothetical protein